MKRTIPIRPTLAALTLAATIGTLAAPMAEASHVRNGAVRYKGGPAPVVRYESPRSRVVVREHSDAAPLLAGLIGGFVLGTIVNNSHPVVHADYSYWDPYCEESFASLDDYQYHAYRHRHPRIVRVYEVSSGQCVRDLCWRDSEWRPYHGNWGSSVQVRYHGGW